MDKEWSSYVIDYINSAGQLKFVVNDFAIDDRAIWVETSEGNACFRVKEPDSDDNNITNSLMVLGNVYNLSCDYEIQEEPLSGSTVFSYMRVFFDPHKKTRESSYDRNIILTDCQRFTHIDNESITVQVPTMIINYEMNFFEYTAFLQTLEMCLNNKKKKLKIYLSLQTKDVREIPVIGESSSYPILSFYMSTGYDEIII